MLCFLKECEVSRIEWSLFVHNHSKGNIFQIPEYYEANTFGSNILPFSFCVKDDDCLVGLVSGQIIYNGGQFFRRFSSRAIIFGGPLLIGDERQQREILSFLLNKLKHELKGNVIYIQFRNLWDWQA